MRPSPRSPGRPRRHIRRRGRLHHPWCSCRRAGDPTRLSCAHQGSATSRSTVEVAACPRTIHILDSKDKQRGQLSLSLTAWDDFLAYAARS
ncbi:DUF397 domain-containing protein [Kitasatospora aureofaciens]|uniref:DUF397 domain-containing protein n=1 Tax=Kitasatospora aureofaciens TaxID=1894 RepID=UPI000998739D|nr:DUF397 domain-containing protein [Kitasatospora aureofaciens]